MALIIASEQVRNEAAGHHDLAPVPYELLAPPELEHQDWRELYANELTTHPRIGWPMAQENPLGFLLKRYTRPADEVRAGQAGLLSPLESRTLELWARGESFRAMAEATGTTPGNCLNRVNRGLEKLRAAAGVERLEGCS
jgi:DNA-directed RNA polymerase specialized sigma24 family protein